MTKISVTS